MGIAPGVNLQVFHCHRRGDQTAIEGAVMAEKYDYITRKWLIHPER